MCCYGLFMIWLQFMGLYHLVYDTYDVIFSFPYETLGVLSIGSLSDELREQLGFGLVFCVLDLENLERGFWEYVLVLNSRCRID